MVDKLNIEQLRELETVLQVMYNTDLRRSVPGFNMCSYQNRLLISKRNKGLVSDYEWDDYTQSYIFRSIIGCSMTYSEVVELMTNMKNAIHDKSREQIGCNLIHDKSRGQIGCNLILLCTGLSFLALRWLSIKYS